MMAAMKKKADAEFKEFLGESLNSFTLSKEGIDEYNTLSKIALTVTQSIIYGEREAVYRSEFAKKLREVGYDVKEEVTYYQETPTSLYRPRADLCISNENGECVVELKLARRRQDFLQLAEYILLSELQVGHLVVFLRNRVELYTLLHISDKIYCFFKNHLYLLPLQLLSEDKGGTSTDSQMSPF